MNETNKGVVDRAVAVRVKLAHDVTDNARALAELLVWAVAAVVHRVKHAAVNRLQAIANVWQCTSDDNAHRVVEVRALHFDLEVDLLYVVEGVWCGCFVSHGFLLSGLDV